ncbi:ras-related protein Rab-24 isoform X1 [Hyla sarda]|uniref:ras-related protein Rab-24 isoform X1 n=1 Tax=Hyla sarda TaxID=327740 RepID=UPI0024C3CB7B|nr:ras-related protein Rab-24 isoform X1 [Hyla sarda]
MLSVSDMLVFSWNVKDLRSPNKRMQILRHLNRLHPDVALLQETHLTSDDMQRMNNLWVGSVHGSSAVGGKAGTLILIHKHFTGKVITHDADPDGRWVRVHLQHEGHDFSLYSCYAPNGDNKPYFLDLEQRLLTDMVTSKIVGGDMNAVAVTLEDRRGGLVDRSQTRPSDRNFGSFLTSTGLNDPWRVTHPDSRDFMHFSHSHNSWSRIDYLLVSPDLFSRVVESDIHVMVISDHSPISMSLTDSFPRGADFQWRFPTYMAKDDNFVDSLKSWWLEFTWSNREHFSDAPLYWESAKVVLRGRLLAYMTTVKKKSQYHFQEASKKLQQVYIAYISQPSTAACQAWKAAKTTFDLWSERKCKAAYSRFRAELFRFGNKSGRLLARLAKGRYTPEHFSSLHDDSGGIHTDPKSINSIFHSYYSSLYSASPVDVAAGRTFLDLVRTPNLYSENRDVLNADFTEDEVRRTIKNLHNSKAPDPDGFTGEFYKILVDQVVPPLTSYFNHVLHSGSLPLHSNTTIIKLLLKPGKDPLLPQSYRPISLINQDIKLMSKIMADRLSTLMPALIGSSQVGFVRNRSAVTNIRKVLAVLDRVQQCPKPGEQLVLLTLDAEKVFDNVRWDWLGMVLEKVGIRGSFRTFLNGLYAAPVARVFTSGFLSPSFPIFKGTRQGPAT